MISIKVIIFYSISNINAHQKTPNASKSLSSADDQHHYCQCFQKVGVKILAVKLVTTSRGMGSFSLSSPSQESWSLLTKLPPSLSLSSWWWWWWAGTRQTQILRILPTKEEMWRFLTNIITTRNCSKKCSTNIIMTKNCSKMLKKHHHHQNCSKTPL